MAAKRYRNRKRVRPEDHPDHGAVIYRVRVSDAGGFNYMVEFHIDMPKMIPHIQRALYGWGKAMEEGQGNLTASFGGGAVYMRLRPMRGRGTDGFPTGGRITGIQEQPVVDEDDDEDEDE